MCTASFRCNPNTMVWKALPASPRPDESSFMTDDPHALFEQWYAEAKASEPNDPSAMALATADAEGRPSVRMVLLKGHDDRGFVFYTNYQSRKGAELTANPQAALGFHWKSLRRQVRIEGRIESVSTEEADRSEEHTSELQSLMRISYAVFCLKK